MTMTPLVYLMAMPSYAFKQEGGVKFCLKWFNYKKVCNVCFAALNVWALAIIGSSVISHYPVQYVQSIF
jgi:hypothetical protein